MKLLKIFCNFSEYAAYALDEFGDTAENCKWYEYKEDLTKFSKKYPDVLFELEGKGEENDDMWILYVKDGKFQKEMAKIVFEAFDSKKLK